MDIRFDGKVAMVTGAAGGIGFACARLLAQSGATVAMVGRTGEKIHAAATLLAGAGRVAAYPMDVTAEEEVRGTVERIRRDLGEIDILIQAAGMAFPSSKPFDGDSWNNAMAVNATGSFQVMGAVVEQSMLPRETGSIVNIASVAGLRGMLPPLDNYGYCAGKAALISLTRQSAVTLAGRNIRVNAVAPGGVASGGVGLSHKQVRAVDDPSIPYLSIIPQGRHSTPDEVAAAVCFLASDWSGSITGQILAVDGGVTAIGF